MASHRSNKTPEPSRNAQEQCFCDQSSQPHNGGRPAYDDWEDKQLMEEASRRGVRGFESMSRDQLLTALASPDAQRGARQARGQDDTAISGGDRAA